MMNFAVHAERCAKELNRAIEASGEQRRSHFDRAARHAKMARKLARSPKAVEIADEMNEVMRMLEAAPAFWWANAPAPPDVVDR